MRLSLVLIILLLFATTLLPEAEKPSTATSNQQKTSVESIASGDSIRIPCYNTSLALLRLTAGKKAGYTPQQMDSLQNIISIRKKF